MLRFGITGGGIAGLLTALALQRDGHKAQIFERRTVLDELGAGLQLSPNAMRVARHLGLLDAIASRATESQGVRMRRGRDGADLAFVPLGTEARTRYGAPFLLVHRADLQSVLVEALLRMNPEGLQLSTSITRTDPQSATMELDGSAGPRMATCDGIVRADGLHAVHGDGARDAPSFSGQIAWRALIPAADLPSEYIQPQSNVWLGAHAHVVHYPVRGGTLINIIAVIEDRVGREDGADLWAQPGDRDRLRRRLAGWDGAVRRLVDAAPSWRTWPLYDGLRSVWSHGRETVVGDAAHPMLPFLAQGASQAFEDAQALRLALRTTEDVTEAFATYARARVPRAHRIQRASSRQGRVYHLAGAPGLARDLALRALGPRRLLARMDWIYRGTELASESEDFASGQDRFETE